MATVVENELPSVNPATLDVVGSVRVTAPEGVAQAVDEARAAQEIWARATFGERRVLLVDVARLVLERMDEIAATITAETGKAHRRGIHDRAPARG